MEDKRVNESHGQAVLRRFESYGLWGGLCLGASVGMLATGPLWHDWSVDRSVLVVIASAVGGAVIGYFAGTIATASLAKGPHSGVGGGSSEAMGSAEGGSGDGGGTD